MPPFVIPRNRPLVVASLVAAGFVAARGHDGSYRFGVITSLAVSLITLSLVLLTGMVGQISLVQTAFAGVAGLAVSKSAPVSRSRCRYPRGAGVAAVGGVIVGSRRCASEVPSWRS